MKPSLIILSSTILLLLAGCGAVLVNEGSRNEPLRDGLRNPADMKAKVVVPLAQKVVGDFDNGSPKMNPQLYGAPGGVWAALASGGNSVGTPFVVSGGANGTAMAVHIYGTLVNKGDNQYPSFSLQGNFRPKGYYDASPFQGIRFYYKCPLDDQASSRRFSIPVGATLPKDNGGNCSDGCYNHFGADLSPSADWAEQTFAFGALKRQAGWGSPVSPPDFTDHLDEVAFLQWIHGTGNQAGSYKIDFWVDGVEFY